MKFKAVSILACVLTSGACFAQAPVVDAQSSEQTNVSQSDTVQDVAVTEALTTLELQNRLSTLERIVDSRTQSQQRMQAQISELQIDIDEMRGTIELHNHQLEKLLERQRELFLELDRRFVQMQEQTNDVGDSLAGGSDGGLPVANAGANQVNEQESYQNAVNLILKERDYDNAIPAFQAFLEQFPNGNLTDNAHYWLGQLLYNKQNFSEASSQFTQVVDEFPDSPKRADSILKLGLIEQSLGNTSAANNRFQQVVSQYPNSTPAKLATQQLSN